MYMYTCIRNPGMSLHVYMYFIFKDIPPIYPYFLGFKIQGWQVWYNICM